MITGNQPKLLLDIDEDGKFKIHREQLELLGLDAEYNWQLTKPEDPSFIKQSKDIVWLSFNEDRTFKEKHLKPEVGRCLLMSPFNQFFTWQTTLIVKILESKKDYWLFRTENTLYLLKKIEEEPANSIETLEAEESI